MGGAIVSVVSSQPVSEWHATLVMHGCSDAQVSVWLYRLAAKLLLQQAPVTQSHPRPFACTVLIW